MTGASSWLDNNRGEVLVVLALCCAALIVRAVTLAHTIEVPGDGPTRAMMAYEWSRHPRLETYGIWLPGFIYLAGVSAMAIPHPLIAARMANLVLGTLTIAVFYALVRQLHGTAVAALSAFALVCFPLHVVLSVSSLTEPSYLLFVMAGLLFLTRAVEKDDVRVVDLLLSLLFFSLADITRYEAWSLIPLILAYLYWRSRSVSATLFAAVGLSFIPAGWSIVNYLHTGNPFFGILAEVHPLEGGHAVSAANAVANLVRQARSHLGWVLSIAAMSGLIGEFSRSLRRQVSVDRTAYLLLVGAVWIAIFFAAARSFGPVLEDRYLLFGFALAIPLAFVQYLRIFGRYRASLVFGAVAAIVSMTVAFVANPQRAWVTTEQPAEIIELARWLPTSPYRNEAVLLTKLDWQSTYLPLYAPQLSGHYFIVSVWVDDVALRRFIQLKRPALLITQAEDAAYRARIEHILGHAIAPERRVYGVGRAEVYDLANLLPANGG